MSTVFSRTEVRQRVIDIFHEQLGVAEKDTLTDATHLVDDLGADSLDTVELTMEFEQEFDIVIPDDEAEKLHTIGDYVDFIWKEYAR